MSIRPKDSNISSSCAPHPHLFPVLCSLLHSSHFLSSLMHVVLSLFSPPTLSLSIPWDIWCPKTICVSALTGHSLCPLLSSNRICYFWFMCLTECTLASARLVFSCYIPPVFHYSHCSCNSGMSSIIKNQCRFYVQKLPKNTFQVNYLALYRLTFLSI